MRKDHRTSTWDGQRKLMFAKLVLCGVMFEKRGPAWNQPRWAGTKWYITLPPHAPCNDPPSSGYIMGPYSSKSEAVDRAAVYMEIPYEHQ